MDCLVTLARNYNRTVVFTIHQPRSNIVALFDQLVLLAQGRLVYSGALEQCQAYFEGIGHPCPPGFNISDYLFVPTLCAYSLGGILLCNLFEIHYGTKFIPILEQFFLALLQVVT